MILEQNKQYQFIYQINRTVTIARNINFILNRMLRDITIKNIRFSRNRLILIIQTNITIDSNDADENLQDVLIRHFKLRNITLINITEHRRLLDPSRFFDRMSEAGRTVYRDIMINFRLVVVAIAIVGISVLYIKRKEI